MASACALTRWVFCVVVFFGWPCLAATEREAWLEVYRAGLGPYSSSEKLERCQSLSVPARFKCLAFTGEHRALTQLYEQALPLASESPTSDEAPFFFSNEPTDVPYRATGFRWAAECAARLLKEAGPGTTDEQRKPWVATGIELLNRLLTSNRPEARVFAAAALSEYAGPLVYASGDKSGVPREGIAAVCRSGPTLATPLLATMAVHSCRKMVSIEEHRELILRTAARWPESSLQFLLWAELPRPTAQLLEPAVVFIGGGRDSAARRGHAVRLFESAAGDLRRNHPCRRQERKGARHGAASADSRVESMLRVQHGRDAQPRHTSRARLVEQLDARVRP